MLARQRPTAREYCVSAASWRVSPSARRKLRKFLICRTNRRTLGSERSGRYARKVGGNATAPVAPSLATLFFFQAEDGIRAFHVTGVQTCALPISRRAAWRQVGPQKRAGRPVLAG